MSIFWSLVSCELLCTALLALKAGLTTDGPRQEPPGSTLSDTFTVFWSSRRIRDDWQSPHCQMLNSRFFTGWICSLTGSFLVRLFWYLIGSHCPFLVVLGWKIIMQQRWAWLHHLPKVLLSLSRVYGRTPQTGYCCYIRLRMPKAIPVISRRSGVAWLKYTVL